MQLIRATLGREYVANRPAVPGRNSVTVHGEFLNRVQARPGKWRVIPVAIHLGGAIHNPIPRPGLGAVHAAAFIPGQHIYEGAERPAING